MPDVIETLADFDLYNEKNASDVMQDFHESANRYANLVEKFEQKVNEYTAAVDRFERGEISRFDLLDTVSEYADVDEKLIEAYCDVTKYQREAQAIFSEVESDISQISVMLSQDSIEEEQVKIGEGEGYEEKDILSCVTPEKDPVEDIADTVNNIVNGAEMYKAGFLDNTFMTLGEALEEVRDPEKQAEINQLNDEEKAEEVMRNPNDRYIGFTRSEGTENMGDVIDEVGSRTPRGKLPNSVDEDELEENSEDIKQAKERIAGKEDLKYIH